MNHAISDLHSLYLNIERQFWDHVLLNKCKDLGLQDFMDELLTFKGYLVALNLFSSNESLEDLQTPYIKYHAIVFLSFLYSLDIYWSIIISLRSLLYYPFP